MFRELVGTWCSISVSDSDSVTFTKYSRMIPFCWSMLGEFHLSMTVLESNASTVRFCGGLEGTTREERHYYESRFSKINFMVETVNTKYIS